MRRYFSLVVGVLVLTQGYSSDKDSQPNASESNATSSNDSGSSATSNTGPSTAEVIAGIANDPGAAFGGER